MSRPLRVLILEDNKDDAEFLLLELRRSGFAPDWERVYTPERFKAALQRTDWEVILSDFHMPRFTAIAALDILKENGRDLPFIIVSGSVGEAVAVEAMKAGAHDFFPKTNMARLSAAIERELNEAQVRRERKQALTQLRQAEERYRLVIEHVRDYAIFFLDPEGRVETWNPGAKRTLGYEQQEVLGHSITLFSPEEDKARFQQALERAHATGLVHEEYWTVRKGGIRFWAERSLEVIREGDQLRGYAAVIRDVSERKRLLDDLRLAIRARDDFLSIASHELKTPLTSLQLQIASLQRLTRDAKPVPPAVLQPKVDVIVRQGERLGSLVDSLLDVTRLTSGQLSLQREEVELGSVVKESLARTEEVLRRSGSSVSVKAEGTVVGRWDRLRLEAVADNLLSNALKYGKGKPIEVTLERTDARARLSVTDHGIGIPPEEQARIFQRFERAVPEHHYGGLGIGLWMTRQIVEAHGGTIQVASAEGKGSTFTVELPLQPEGGAE
jgi:PAS domain S-box-containing protein